MCPFLPLPLKMNVFVFFPYFASRNISYSPVEMIDVFFWFFSAAVAAANHLTDGEKNT